MISKLAWEEQCNPDWVHQSAVTNQGHPGQDDWQVWQDALTQCLCDNYCRLLIPLGNWKSDAQPSHWFYELTKERLYHDRDQQFFEFEFGVR